MAKPQDPNQGSVRIIGGSCRGRKINFPAIEGLRPTPNRVRETLFNWLAPNINGAICLDLFAGSGALSFEALSRGAKYCLALDASKKCIQALFENSGLLGLTLDIRHATFPYSYELIQEPPDIVFIDPPFGQGLISQVIEWLLKYRRLPRGSLIYIESERNSPSFNLPTLWRIARDKNAGNVRYTLIEVG